MKRFKILQGIKAYKPSFKELLLDDFLRLISLYFNISETNKRMLSRFINQIQRNRKVWFVFLYGSLANKLAYNSDYTKATDIDIFIVRTKDAPRCKKLESIEGLDIHHESLSDLESKIEGFEKQVFSAGENINYVDHIPFEITALASPIVVLKDSKYLSNLKEKVNSLFNNKHLFDLFLLETPLKGVYKSVYYREDKEFEDIYIKRLRELEEKLRQIGLKQIEDPTRVKTPDEHFEIFRLNTILRARSGGVRTLMTYFRFIRKIPLGELSYKLRQQMYNRNFREGLIRRASQLLKKAYETAVINPEDFYNEDFYK